MKLAMIAIAFALVACGPSSRDNVGDGGGPDGASGNLVLSPATATVTVTDGVAATQAYTATLTDASGHMTDVTSSATFSLSNPAFGSFSGATATLTGGGAGVVTVMASAGNAAGTAQLTVNVKSSRVEGTAPTDSGTLFGSATESGTPPTIVYPADGTLAPPNLGAFDVHWTSTGAANLFALDFNNTYVDLTVYTTGMSTQKWWTVLTPAEWAEVAATAQPLTVTVAALNTAAPTTKATSTPIHVSATNETLLGGVYYWSSNGGGGTAGDMFHYDMSAPQTPPAAYYATNMIPAGCIGCHALSHDGTKLAFVANNDGFEGVIETTATKATLFNPGGLSWDFETFNVDGSKIITADDGAQSNYGKLTLRTAATGVSLASVPNSSGKYGNHPDLSADGTMLANIEMSDNTGDVLMPDTGALVVRPFNDAANTFGTAKTIIADDANGPTKLSNFYPSWSPDTQWVLVTRVNASSNNGQSGCSICPTPTGAYANPASETWVVKADGSMPPIQMSTANSTGALGNSWPRWAPFSETVGTTGEKVFFYTFSSNRAFGVRLTAGTPQIWMAPFYPDKAAAGTDPSGPAFRVPFQDITTHNHIAQWSQQIVQIQ